MTRTGRGRPARVRHANAACLGLGLVVLVLAGAVASCGRFALDGGELIAPGGPPGGGGGGGGGGGAPPPDLPPAPSPAVQATLGLLEAVGGDGLLRVDWRVPQAVLDPQPELALFVVDAPGSPFDGDPIPVDLADGMRVFQSFANGRVLNVGLAARALPGDPYTPVGPVLLARIGAPMYVDPAGPSGTGDGSSPANATNDLLLAVVLAFTFGGGNVWVREGDFADQALPMFEGVHVHGGFGPGFVLEERDPDAHVTQLLGGEAEPVVSMISGATTAVLTGVTLDGLGIAPAGVEVVGAPFQGRALEIRGCRRGVLLRNAQNGPAVPVVLVDCEIGPSDLQGVSLEGAFDFVFDGLAISDSGQEGTDLGKWYAPSGATVHGLVRACSFVRSGLEGLDIDLAAPEGIDPPGGHFELTVECCDFQLNATIGLLIDVDYETSPAWSADLVVRGCRSRSNLGAGARLDLDAAITAMVHRFSGSANGADGLLVTSESASGTIVVSTSSFVANQGVGVRTDLGNYGALASHCVVSGNAGGGFAAFVAPASVASGIAFVQPVPFTGASSFAGIEQDTRTPLVFVRAADEHVNVIGSSGGLLTVDADTQAGIGALAELLDDGTPRTVTELGAGTVALDPAPTVVPLPSRLAFFAMGEGVDEDYRLAPGSAAVGAGLAAPSAPLVDAGPFGAPLGAAPGVEEPIPPVLFRLSATTPAWTQPIAGGAELRLAFRGGSPDPATLAAVRAVDAAGAPIASIPFVGGGEVHLPAPVGGWPPGVRVEVHAGLRSTAGTPLAAPVVVPFTRQ